MWGTDGFRIETVDDGWVRVFPAADHFDAYCVGIHAVKTGNRFASLQPSAQGLKRCLVLPVPTRDADWLCAWTTARNIPLTTSSTRSSSGASRHSPRCLALYVATDSFGLGFRERKSTTHCAYSIRAGTAAASVEDTIGCRVVFPIRRHRQSVASYAKPEGIVSENFTPPRNSQKITQSKSSVIYITQ